jgi:hypothetical protein
MMITDKLNKDYMSVVDTYFDEMTSDKMTIYKMTVS